MEEFIEVSWTSGSLDEARKISRKLVSDKLVASAEIIGLSSGINVMDMRARSASSNMRLVFSQAAIRRIAETLLLRYWEEGGTKAAFARKPVAVLCAGDLCWKEENARVDCTALVPG